MKRNFKYLFAMFCWMVFVACGNSKTEGTAEEAVSETAEENSEPVDKVEAGKSIFISNCKLCHGEDGALGSSGAANLKISKLSTQDLNNVVAYGKGNMTGYKGLLEPGDIENVVAYIETLRTK